MSLESLVQVEHIPEILLERSATCALVVLDAHPAKPDVWKHYV